MTAPPAAEDEDRSDHRRPKSKFVRLGNALSIAGLAAAVGGFAVAVTFRLLSEVVAPALQCNGFWSSVLNVLPGASIYATFAAFAMGIVALVFRTRRKAIAIRAVALAPVVLVASVVVMLPFLMIGCSY